MAHASLRPDSPRSPPCRRVGLDPRRGTGSVRCGCRRGHGAADRRVRRRLSGGTGPHLREGWPDGADGHRPRLLLGAGAGRQRPDRRRRLTIGHGGQPPAYLRARSPGSDLWHGRCRLRQRRPRGAVTTGVGQRRGHRIDLLPRSVAAHPPASRRNPTDGLRMSGGREVSGLHRRRVRRERDTPLASGVAARQGPGRGPGRGERAVPTVPAGSPRRRGQAVPHHPWVERSGGARSVRRRKASRVRDRISRGAR